MQRQLPTDPTATSTPPRGSWREQLRAAVRDPDALVDRLALPDDLRAAARRAAEAFGLVAPEAFVDRMRRGDPADPLLAQVLPVADELAAPPDGFVSDPCGDGQAVRAPGLLQKYGGRALLIVAGVCAVACRYCFRREFPYQDSPAGLAQSQPALPARHAAAAPAGSATAPPAGSLKARAASFGAKYGGGAQQPRGARGLLRPALPAIKSSRAT